MLYGTFATRLPNFNFVDSENPIIKYDFEQPTDGYECPWGSVQIWLIYNSETVKNPPRTFEELRSWVKSNPSRFTYDQSFTGVNNIVFSQLNGFC